jgi:hypothetical protein
MQPEKKTKKKKWKIKKYQKWQATILNMLFFLLV